LNIANIFKEAVKSAFKEFSEFYRDRFYIVYLQNANGIYAVRLGENNWAFQFLKGQWFQVTRPPKPSCKACYGTGIYGLDSKTKKEVPCGCMRNFGKQLNGGFLREAFGNEVS
jgi:hypothetical protein